MKNAMILTLLLTLLKVSPVFAITAYESPTKDAPIWEDAPDNNYGSETFVWVGYSYGVIASLMEFDLSSYSGATINNSMLALYRYDGIGTMPESNLYRLNAGWDEGTVTYNNRPTANYDLSETFTPPSSNGWIYINLTDIVQGWVDGGFSNNGLIIWPNYVTEGVAFLYSKEYSNPDLHPVLQIQYTETGIESASLGNIKAAFK